MNLKRTRLTLPAADAAPIAVLDERERLRVGALPLRAGR